jgi:hypothetical protein
MASEKKTLFVNSFLDFSLQLDGFWVEWFGIAG